MKVQKYENDFKECASWRVGVDVGSVGIGAGEDD